MNQTYDFLIIGAGVVGSAVARELSRYTAKTCVLEKNLDVCYEQSGRNSAVIHGGFAYDENSNKAKFCVEGCMEFDALAKSLDIPFKRTGKVLVGNTPEDRERLMKTIETGKKNGAQGLELIEEKRLKELVPAVNGSFAMYSPMSGIVDPFIYTIALAENAHENGVTYHFDQEVTHIEKTNDLFIISTPKGQFKSKWIINSAGNNCAHISKMLGLKAYEIEGTKGEYIVLDQKVGPLLPMPVYPVPTNTYMGIHVTPTIDGNVTVGPNANKESDYINYSVSKESMDFLKEDANTLWPHIQQKDFIRNYAGIQPTWKDGAHVIKDFLIEFSQEVENTVNLIGMESPALTSAVPIARHVVKGIMERCPLTVKKDFNPKRRGIIKFSEQSKEIQAALISQNPDYGEIICRCEKITKAEILSAIHNPLGVDTLTGIKYRTRAMMGRCQGGYCQMRISQMIQTHKNKVETDIMYARRDSYLFTGKVRS
jgi:glycerol-3-phosphate dehydrogenase